MQLAPSDVGALVNLGVVEMRRRNWKQALAYLRQAEKLAPQVPGIRLNIGLAYYREGDYKSAIPPFESVLRDQPQSTQARHLLGLCYFFGERYADAARTLEPLWPASQNDLSYLYVLSVAAGNAGRHDLEEKALARLLEVSNDTPGLPFVDGKELPLAKPGGSGDCRIGSRRAGRRQTALRPLLPGAGLPSKAES